jgi:hypothetical protein
VRNDAGGGGTGRGRSRAAWGAAAAALATGVFALALLTHATPAAQRASAARAAGAHAMPSAMVACERSGQQVCNPAARDGFPLDHPMAPGARVLTLQQAVAEQGWTGDIVRARLMTYGQAAEAFPALAASRVAPSREVWVLTRYFAKPVTMPFAGGYGPPGEPATIQVSAVSVVIDATTGTETDWCQGCAVLPRSG